jgi:DNA polymerase II small subunit/DNA polymerase delta subunit B
MNPKHFEMRKIDYVVVSLALGYACKIIAKGMDRSLSQVREEIINTASNQAHTLTQEEADVIVKSYQDCLHNPQQETQVKEFIFFDAASNN